MHFPILIGNEIDNIANTSTKLIILSKKGLMLWQKML